MCQSAERKSPKERLREHRKQKEIHGNRNDQCDKESGIPERVDQLPRQQEEAEYVGGICEKQNGYEEAFGMF